MPSIPADYLDGTSPLPVQGSLAVVGRDLVFSRSLAQAVRVPVAELAPPRRVSGVVRLEPRLRNPALPNPCWMVDAGTFARDLLPDLRQVRRGYGRRVGWATWLLLCVLLLPPAFVVTLEATEAAHVLVPVSREVKMGESIHAMLARGYSECTDPALTNALQRMVAELADPASPYKPTVSVWIDPTPNAFALPGGRIVVFSGLFPVCGTPEALAGVLAHELAHVERRHSLRQIMRSLGLLHFSSAVIGGNLEGLEALEQISELGSLLALLKYSREAEAEADALAVQKLHARRISVAGLESFFTNLRAREPALEKLERGLAMLSSHPLTAEREARLRAVREAETFTPAPLPGGGVDWTSAGCPGAVQK
jgi:beta-barrel assembly-enhancing protease